VFLGFALTEHCNLRCPHCIRDDVTQVRSLDLGLLLRTVDDARALFGDLTVSFTGGEPTLHPSWKEIIAAMHERGVPYRFVSNGWHMRRLLPDLKRYPPQVVRLSLSGATEEVHDEERGRGSFRRVLLAVGMLTSLSVPTDLTIVVDRRDRHQLREAADLAEALGCVRIHFILPQPVLGSVQRDSDLPPAEWWPVRDEIQAMAAEPHRRTQIVIDYGAPMDGEEVSCETFDLSRVYVDTRGRLSLCCQLSEYGFNTRDVVADLSEVAFSQVWTVYQAAIEAQKARSRPRGDGDPIDAMPCIRCAKALGKMEWIRGYPASPWHAAAGPGLVTLRMAAAR
jgi:MoaA/NifB/PqqE/SkfB family radical SAM enzyme